MTIQTVVIGAVTTEVYGGLTAATAYIDGKFGSARTTWFALSADDKARTLIEATRYLDQQPWDGTRTGLAGVTATTLEWPRSGITLGDGTPVDSTTVPVEVVEATFELAMIIAVDESVTSKQDQGSNISSVSAGGGVGVSFFAPTSALFGTATTMPVVVQRLVGRFLASALSGGDGSSAGIGNSCSSFRVSAGFPLSEPR